MLSAEECIVLLDCDVLSFEDSLVLDCNINKLEIPALDLTLTLNESQKRLLVCLIKKINCKRKIINIVWYENHQRISDNNYHQLTFQLRALLQKNNLPNNLLVTIPYYGLKLNEALCRTITENSLITKEDKKVVAEIKKTEITQTHTESIVNKNLIIMFLFMVFSLFILWLE